MIDELACAVTPSASRVSNECVHGVLHRSPLSVQQKVRTSFREKSHCFDKLFVSEKLDLDDVGCKQLIPECPTPPAEEKDIPLCSHCPHEVSYCNDVPKFVADYVTARGRTADEVALIKIGADGGGASLKVMLQLLFDDDHLLQQPPGVGVRRMRRGEFKDSGVRRVLIIAVAPKCSESYHNVNAIMTKLRLETLRDLFTKARICYAVDLKMALVLLGLKCSGSRFACPYCMFSRWKAHSCSHQKRTFLGLTTASTTVQRRMANRRSGKAKPGECGSSSGEPPMMCLEVADDIM